MILLFLGGSFSVFIFKNAFMDYLIARVAFFIFIILMIIEMHHIFPKEIRPRNILVSIFAGMLYPVFAMLKYTQLDTAYFPAFIMLGIMMLFFILCFTYNKI